MMKIVNGKILTPSQLLQGYGILIEEDLIKQIAPMDKLPTKIPEIDAMGKWVIPGLIDIHIHGSSGADTMDHDLNAFAALSRFLAANGVTSFLPTTVAASNQDIKSVISAMRQYQMELPGARLLGLHLEGPYLQTLFRGAQTEQNLRPANPEEYLPWLNSGFVKLMTVAPEIDGVLELIQTGTSMGIKFAIGHSSASYETVLNAVEAGLNQSTHTFNAMPPLHHREPGVLGAVLTDERIYAQVIADGVHLHPAIVKLLFRLKGIGKTILITDAIRATGMPDGKYHLGEQPVIVKNGIARTISGALAGSTLILKDALKNSTKFTGQTWQDLLPSATSVPAESLNMKDQIGVIQPGALADIVIMDEHLSPQLTLISGKIAYKSSNY